MVLTILEKWYLIMAKDDFSCIPSLIWQKEIVQKFQRIISGRYDCLDHFAINLILLDNVTVNLCSNASYILQYKKQGMYKFASGLRPDLIDLLPVIPWRLLLSPNDGARLQKYVSFKEIIHGLYNGMSFVHKIDDIHLNVAVASRSKNPRHALTFLNNAEDVLNLGAYFYHIFKAKLEEFYNLNLPTIEEIVLNNQAYQKLDVMSRNWHDKRIFIL
jgi:hypothetical protein